MMVMKEEGGQQIEEDEVGKEGGKGGGQEADGLDQDDGNDECVVF